MKAQCISLYYVVSISPMKQQFVVTYRYTILQLDRSLLHQRLSKLLFYENIMGNFFFLIQDFDRRCVCNPLFVPLLSEH